MRSTPWLLVCLIGVVPLRKLIESAAEDHIEDVGGAGLAPPTFCKQWLRTVSARHLGEVVWG